MTNPDHMQRAREFYGAALRKRGLKLDAEGIEGDSVFPPDEHGAAALDAIAAALSEAQGAQWQPIETAPKDIPPDDAVIVCITYDEARFARQRMVGEAYRMDGVWWWAGTAPGDYYTDPIEDMYGEGCVTHWRPMPGPPAAVSSEAVGREVFKAHLAAEPAASVGREAPEWLDDVKRCLSDISQEHGHVGRGNRRFEALLTRINATRWQVEPAASVGREAVGDDLMASCMFYTRDALIRAGIIGSTVPPMFVSDAVISAFYGRAKAACYGLRRKGNSSIIGVIPPKIAEKPATSDAWMADYEEVPLYTHPAAVVDEAMLERGVRAAESVSNARLPRYKVVRAILTAALSAPNGGEG